MGRQSKRRRTAGPAASNGAQPAVECSGTALAAWRWSEARGASLGRGVEVRGAAGDTGTGAGTWRVEVSASRALSPGDVVIRLPAHAVLTVDERKGAVARRAAAEIVHADPFESGDGEASGSDDDDDDDGHHDEWWDPAPFAPDGGAAASRDLRWVRATLVAMHGRLAGRDAADRGWSVIADMPDLAALPQPLAWPDGDRVALATLAVGDDADADADEARSAFADAGVREFVVRHGSEFFRGLGGDEDAAMRLYTQCAALLQACAVSGDRGEPMVVPLLAVLEWAADGNCAVEVGPHGVAVMATEPVPAGSAVRVGAGVSSSSELIRRYGVAPVSGTCLPGDCVHLTPGELAAAVGAAAGASARGVAEGALFERKLKLLADRGFLCAWDRGVFRLRVDDVAAAADASATNHEADAAGLPRALVAALVMSLTREELDAFENANHVALVSDDDDSDGDGYDDDDDDDDDQFENVGGRDLVLGGSDDDDNGLDDGDEEFFSGIGLGRDATVPRVFDDSDLGVAAAAAAAAADDDDDDDDEDDDDDDDDGDVCPQLVPAAMSPSSTLPRDDLIRGWQIVRAALAPRHCATNPDRVSETPPVCSKRAAAIAASARGLEHSLIGELLEALEHF